MVRRLRPEATLRAAIFSRLRLRLAQLSHQQMPWQPLTRVARRIAPHLFPVLLSNSASPFASTCGGLLEQADTGPSDTCAFRVALRAGLQHDQSVGHRRTSTAHRPRPNEGPQTVGHHRARPHLVHHAAWPAAHGMRVLSIMWVHESILCVGGAAPPSQPTGCGGDYFFGASKGARAAVTA